jgi:CheY-like chemotaxis protein
MDLLNDIFQTPRYRKLSLVVVLIWLLLLNVGVIAFTQQIQGGTRVLLLIITWIAQLMAFTFGRVVRPPSGQIQARPAESLATITHELRTPVSLIVGFCESILSPARAQRDREPLPAAYRSDIEAIHRNATHLQKAVEDVLDILKARAIPVSAPHAARATGKQGVPEQPTRHLQTQVEKQVAQAATSDDESPATKKSLIVLSEDPVVAELFRSSISRFEVIGATDIREIESVAADVQLAAVIVSGEESHVIIPEIPHVIGEQVPIMVCSMPGEQYPEEIQKKTTILIKPITFQTLSDALERLRSPIRNILIVDDNRDNVEMISRMIESMPDQTHIWKTYSGREGLALMYEQPMDVVILDLLLPDMNGANLSQYIRVDQRLAMIPILIVSAYHELAIANPPPILGKISILRFAGFQSVELVHTIESLAGMFSSTP